MEIEAGSALPYDDLPTPISPNKSPTKKGKVLNLEKLKMEFQKRPQYKKENQQTRMSKIDEVYSPQRSPNQRQLGRLSDKSPRKLS